MPLFSQAKHLPLVKATTSRRDLLIKGLSLSTAMAIPVGVAKASAAPTSQSQARSDAALTIAFDRIYEDMLALSPELATQVGHDNSDLRKKLDDRSLAGADRKLAASQAAIDMLQAIAPHGLSSDRNRQRLVVLDVLKQRVRTWKSFAYGDERFFAYRLTQFTGAYATVPQTLAQMGTPASPIEQENYLARLAGFARALDQDTARQTADAQAGVVAPAFVLDVVIDNLSQFRQSSIVRDRLIAPLARGQIGAAQLAAEAGRIFDSEIQPAIDRQLEATRKLREGASEVPGVWRLPNGERFYADALEVSASTSIDPDKAHETGLEEVRKLEELIDSLLRKQGLIDGSCADRLTILKNDPSELFANDESGRAALIEFMQQDIAMVREALPSAFRTLPKLDPVVERLPSALEGVGPVAAYEPGTRDGSRPPQIFVDLKDMAKWPRFSVKTLCRHEGIPGHHVQGSFTSEHQQAHPLLGLFYYPAYMEGWALYAEQLTQEMGLYREDPKSEIGMWQSLLLRAARIVVDTGIHHKRWTRTQAVDYLSRTTAMPRKMLETEVNRYSIIPGQACAYMLGQLEWQRIRTRFRAITASAYDIRDFHEVLKFGPMPIAMLEESAMAIAVNLRSAKSGPT